MKLTAKTRFDLLDNLPKDFKVGIEIGVRFGYYSDEMLKRTNMKVYSVDPWERNSELHEPERAWADTRVLLDKYGDRSIMVRDYSYNVDMDFEDESVDFVYIDGLHTYEAVKFDIMLYWPKVKPGGVLAGHDYGPDWPGIVKTVDEFVEKHGLELNLTTDQPTMEIDEGQHSWFIVKPK